MNYYKNDIRNVRGDTYSSALVIEGLGQALDNVYFSCRDSLNDNSNLLFEKSLYNGITEVEYDPENDIRKYAVRIAPVDTFNIQAGTYYYDLQINVNNDVFTIMKGKFIIEQDCTRRTNPPDDPELYIKIILDDINGEIIGTSVIDKTDYLNQTKTLIRNALNQFFDTEITETATFRSYADTINELYQDYPQNEGGE